MMSLAKSNKTLRSLLLSIGTVGAIGLFTIPTIAQSPSPSASPSSSPKPTTTPKASPSPTSSPAPAGNQSLTQLLTQASSAGSFTTMARAVQAAGVASAIKPGAKYTIFAPTDAAFAELPAGTLDKLLKPENRKLLAEILAYHVASGQYTSSQLKTGGLPTIGGGLAIDVTPQRIIVNNASVVQPDIRATNGVIHGVSRVLISKELRQRLSALK